MVLMAACTGCAKNKFTARTLPRRFHAMPTTNAKTIDLTRLASATLQNDLINKGDVIEVNISAGLSKDDTIEVVSRVNDRGEASLPHVGDVPLEGLELEEAEAVISTACIERGLFRAPHVTVTMKRPKVNRVTVVGAVEEQGTYELRSGQTDLLAALVAAGGLAEDAGTVVEIRHPGYRNTRRPPPAPPIAGDDSSGTGHALTAHTEAEPAGASVQQASGQTLRVDLTSLTNVSQGNRLELEDGTVIMVERRDPQPIQVLGLVRKPDVYDFPVGKNLRVLDALAMAGGIDSPVANKLYVIRRRPGMPEPAVIELSLSKAKRNGMENLLLEPGDTVSVEQTPATIVLEAVRMIGIGVSGRLF